MPRLAPLVVVGFFNAAGATGCWFSADYRSGNVACRDGICPAGLACVAEVCVARSPADGRGSDVHDAKPSDAPSQMAALTCADPGTFIADSTVTGTTDDHSNLLMTSCNGTVMNGNETVYKIAGTMSHQVTLTPHSTAYPVAAYVISPCTPGFPSCLDNVFATDTAPATVTFQATTDYFIVVDGINPAQHGAYTLTISLN